MDKQRRSSLVLNVTQVLIWIFVILMPAILNIFLTGNKTQTAQVFKTTLVIMAPVLFLYIVNYFWLVPKFLFVKNKKKWFWIINALLLLALDARYMFPGPIPEDVQTQLSENLPFPIENLWAWYAGTIFMAFLVQCVFILLAVGVRQIQRNHELRLKIEEEKRKGTEAELNWLKHQLNPHFLFNTLNNISSLTQIDPDKAQESIGQLSDLLRYALYDTDKDFVPLSGEIEFMDNYIHLMQLRCNERSEVTTEWDLPAGEIKIAPLLFISLIENAFKHGVNARMDSFVHISLRPEGNDLVFRCENSMFEKTGEDHIGSGIGVENLKRRLELIYPGSYSYEQTDADGVYAVRLVLKNLIG